MPLDVNASLPEKMQKLFQPIRHKVLYGGRGGAKSHSVARALLIMGLNRSVRVVCTREVQKSIKDSVHQLLKSTIEELGLSDVYTVQETTIFNHVGTSFIFMGLSSATAMNLKSLEGCDICWVEEAQTVSKKSWTILMPTIRKKGSEVWVTFNPDLDTDETWVRWVVSPPPNTWVQLVNYTDNPWFENSEMPATRAHDERMMTKEEYENVWLGIPRSSVQGAIYSAEIRDMLQRKRYRAVPYDPQLLVHTIWDLGNNDQTAVVFAQRLHSEVRIIDYMEGSFLSYANWAKVLDRQPYTYGYDFLPWDGGIVRQDTGMSARGILRKLGRRARVIKKHEKADRIRTTRMMFPRVYLDDSGTTIEEPFENRVITRGGERLLECLRRYRRNIPRSTDEPSEPVHDEFSHGADAFGGLSRVIDKLVNELQKDIQFEEWGQSVRGVM
jgi:phage terminase large subunit